MQWQCEQLWRSGFVFSHHCSDMVAVVNTNCDMRHAVTYIRCGRIRQRHSIAPCARCARWLLRCNCAQVSVVFFCQCTQSVGINMVFAPAGRIMRAYLAIWNRMIKPDISFTSYGVFLFEYTIRPNENRNKTEYNKRVGRACLCAKCTQIRARPTSKSTKL